MALENLSESARDEMAALVDRLNNDPSTHNAFLRMAKKVTPGLPVPELEMEDRTNDALRKAYERIDSMSAKQAERDAIDTLKDRRQSLLRKGLVKSEDEIQEVEKIMVEKKISDHETAAEYHKWMQQAAVPTPNGYNPNPMKKFDLSAFSKNPVTAARDVARQALDEIRRPQRPIGL
jgi:hypothetical protein